MKKTQKGFTLVELVVVIAIIGVLAAILVPSMLNYVKKSRLKTANSNAKTAYNAAAEMFADAETQGISLNTCLSTTNANAPENKYKIQVNHVYDAKSASAQESDSSHGGVYKISRVLAENGNESGVWKVQAAQTNGQNTFVVYWAKTTSDQMVGRYPDAITWDEWKDDNKTANGVSNASSPITTITFNSFAKSNWTSVPGATTNGN